MFWSRTNGCTTGLLNFYSILRLPNSNSSKRKAAEWWWEVGRNGETLFHTRNAASKRWGGGVSGWGEWGHLSDRQQRNAFSDKDFSDRCSDIFRAASNSNVGLWKKGGAPYRLEKRNIEIRVCRVWPSPTYFAGSAGHLFSFITRPVAKWQSPSESEYVTISFPPPSPPPTQKGWMGLLLVRWKWKSPRWMSH